MDEVLAASIVTMMNRWHRRARANRHKGTKRRFNKARARRRDRLARESRRPHQMPGITKCSPR